MYILVALMLFGPALVGVLLYERFRGYELVARKRVELLVAFAFVINLGAYAAFWLRSRQFIVWAALPEADVMSVAFVFQYMGLTLFAAAALAYVLSLVRIDKSRRDKPADDTDNTDD